MYSLMTSYLKYLISMDKLVNACLNAALGKRVKGSVSAISDYSMFIATSRQDYLSVPRRTPRACPSTQTCKKSKGERHQSSPWPAERTQVQDRSEWDLPHLSLRSEHDADARQGTS
jgi:hypothetical protein